MMTTAAAIILCAGKGTRMGQSDRSKVCYDCAGIPVIKRIVRNMREGGVGRFVIVVGHMAESVMSALDGEPGVVYAYQKEQKGTGHAALCGLKALQEIGYTGPALVSMGDKIVATSVVKGLLSKISGHPVKAVWGVQPTAANHNGGRVVVIDGKPRGVIELADVGMMALKGEPAAKWSDCLAGIKLNPKKAAKVIAKAKIPGALDNVPAEKYGLSAREIYEAPYANAGLYCFDVDAAVKVISGLGSNNAQGEIYLTDALEGFAAEDAAVIHEVARPEDMLTYSTRLELRTISHRFLRKASEFSSDVRLPTSTTTLLSAFIAKYGDRPCILTSAPGRVNIMGRHIDHRGGSYNVMTTEQRTWFVASPREDDIVHIANLDPTFPETEFRIGEYLRCTPRPTSYASPDSTAAWLDFLDTSEIKSDLASSRGHWQNYVKGAVLRFQFAEEFPLCGMDVMVHGNIPVAAGLSSSSALVVATAEAVVALNSLNVSTRQFVDLCGEGEWYVGSRGGAGDHAAMKCGAEGKIVHLKFKPFEIGESVPFPRRYSIVVVNSGEMAKKSEGAKETFNARVRDYETAFTDIKRHYPDLPVAYFRDLAFLPEADREKALACLTGSVKGVAKYGIAECRRAEECLDLLKRGDLVALGKMMKESHDGDRIGAGGYECSTVRIDALCDRLNAVPGVLGSQIVGAGLGGCVIALVEGASAQAIADKMASDGFKSFVCSPSCGSQVVY